VFQRHFIKWSAQGVCSKTPQFARWTVLVMAALLSFLQLGLTSCRAMFGPPSDASLERGFSQHEPELNQLVTMAKQDQHLVRIAPTFTWLDTDVSWPRQNIGLSVTRWNEYRRLFKEVGAKYGLVRSEDHPGVIFFGVYGFGLVSASTYKGYAYSEHPLTPIVPSLDQMTVPDKGSAVGFKQIRPNWYIYEED
jgi:hypothetical protein